jgi:hypothetical protein
LHVPGVVSIQWWLFEESEGLLILRCRYEPC